MASDIYQPTQIFDVTIHSVCKSLKIVSFCNKNGDISGDLQTLWTLLRECLEVITKKAQKAITYKRHTMLLSSFLFFFCCHFDTSNKGVF